MERSAERQSLKTRLLSLIGAGAVAAGSLIHPESSAAQEQNHPFNNSSREILTICMNENQEVDLRFLTHSTISINGTEFTYGGNHALVLGNTESGRSIIAGMGSTDRVIDAGGTLGMYSMIGMSGPRNRDQLDREDAVVVSLVDARFTPGVYRYSHPNFPNLQAMRYEGIMEALPEVCYTENNTPERELPVLR